MLNELDVLERHRLLSSDDYAQIKERVSAHLCPHSFEVLADAPVHTRMNGVFFGDAALLDLHYAAPVRIGVGDVTEHYLFRLTVAGRCEVTHGERRAAMQTGALSVTSPFARSSITTDGHCRNLILRVGRNALSTQLQQLTGRSLHEPLIFEVGVAPEHVGVARIRHTLAYLCQLHAVDAPACSLDRCLSDFVLQLLLTQLPHNHSAQLLDDRQALLPRHVRLARDYIEAHLHEPITLAQLCSLCGVSARTLQNGFNRFLRQSPVDYIRDRRLARVHEALKKGAPGQTITDVLLSHGIHSFGHFTNAYRRRYGCPPSETLRRRH